MNRYFYCDHGGRESRRTAAVNCINLCPYKQDYTACQCFDKNVSADEKKQAEADIAFRKTSPLKRTIMESRQGASRAAAENAEKRRAIMGWHPFKDCYNQTQLYDWKLKILRDEDVDLSGIELRAGNWWEWKRQKLDPTTILDAILQTTKPQHWDLIRKGKNNGDRLDTRDIHHRDRDHGLVRDGKERRSRLPHFTAGITGLQVEKQIPSFSSSIGS